MKKTISILTIMCLFFSTQVEAQGFWKKVGRFLGNAAEVAIVAGVDHITEKYAPEQVAQYRQSMQQLNEQSQKRAEEDAAAWNDYKSGRKVELQRELRSVPYSDRETREYIQSQIDELDGISTSPASNYNTSLAESFSANVGIKQQNINKGIAWNDASNKYERQNVKKDLIFDAAGDILGNSELLDKFRQISETQNTYLSESSKAMTAEEKQGALSKRNQAYFDIGYDTYQNAKDRQAQHLAEKLQVSQKLMESGWYNDAQLANEVAGSIIAIQKSDLSVQEKTILLSAYGLGDAKQISQAVDEVLAEKSNADAERIKAEEEAKRQAEIQERKAAEERKNALQALASAKINGYAFDETTLSTEQKSTLDGIAETLNKYSDITVLITGHTCKIGYKNINLKKGLKRAKMAKEYLIEKGIVTERIIIESKGEEQPLVPNTSSDNRKQNRRLEFVVK
jgi:outer membrane protein OmpA-like peptidoglycan-associated protein